MWQALLGASGLEFMWLTRRKQGCGQCAAGGMANAQVLPTWLFDTECSAECDAYTKLGEGVRVGGDLQNESGEGGGWDWSVLGSQ